MFMSPPPLVITMETTSILPVSQTHSTAGTFGKNSEMPTVFLNNIAKLWSLTILQLNIWPDSYDLNIWLLWHIFCLFWHVSSCPIVPTKILIQGAPFWLVAIATSLFSLFLHGLSFCCSPATHHVSWIPPSLCLFHLNFIFSVRS